MKRSIAFCVVLLLQGLNSFGQTNAAPPTGLSIPGPEWQRQLEVSKSKSAGVTNVPAGGILSTNAQFLPPKLVTSRGVKQEKRWTLWGPVQNKDYGAELEGAFRPNDAERGETSIRDTVITIFPTGR